MKGHSRGVEVFVRIRPTPNFAHDLVECLPDGQTVNVTLKKDSRKPSDCKNNQLSSWSFRLEGVLHNASQDEAYSRVCRRVVLGALDGYNGTVMCFGQTGAGKTYTMTGSMESYKQRGIVPRALQEVFQEVEKRTEQVYSVHMSYLEIYNENLVDLLSSLQPCPHLPPRGMVVMEEPERGVVIRGLSLHPVHNEEEALNLLFEGEMNRIIGSHDLNRKSSRSHCILTVHIESHSRTLSDAKYITSKLNLVDLAGSERLGKTGSEGQMLQEAKYINKSLSFLEQTILALADRRREHVPFRQSRLTHALKDSLGGNCNTVLVANIYGEASQIEETLSTLRFASRMKCVPASPAVNEHMDSAALIKKLQKEVQTLKDELSISNMVVGHQRISYEPLTEAQLAEIQCQVQRYLEGSLEEINITSVRQVQAVFAQFKLALQMQEQKIKAQLLQTYNLVLKDQSANAADIQAWDIRGEPERVDSGSMGTSARSQKQSQRSSSPKAKNQRQKSKEKHSQSRRQREGTPLSKKFGENASKATPDVEQESEEPDADYQDTQELPANEPNDYESPPPKSEAFEDFKLGRGRRLNVILKENKAVLLERRSLSHQLTEEVNAIKREMDCITVKLQQLEGREGQHEGFTPQESRDSLLVRLRELKSQYRPKYEVLCHNKAEVNYCQHLVDQCRIRLLSDFESWYQKSFPLPEDDPDTEANKDGTQEVDIPRCEEQLQRERFTNSSNESFHSARHRTQKRRSSREPSFNPVQQSSSSASGARRPFLV